MRQNMVNSSEEAPNKPAGKGRLSRFFLNSGKLILDITKLTFAALVLGSIMKGDFSPSTLLTAGIIVSGAGTILGLALVTHGEEK